MFEPSEKPRIFATPLGVDFPKAFVEGLRARTADMNPEEMARAHVIVNTARMRRRVQSLFAMGPASLMPRISLLGDIGNGPEFHDLPRPVSPLARRMELVPLVHQLVRTDTRLAARRSLFDLSDSLAALMDEMQGEGVPLSAIEKLDVVDASGHWERAQEFIKISGAFLNSTCTSLDPEGRRRQAVMRMIKGWQDAPPDHPILLVGSTGSRGTTSLLMEAIAKLPNGAVVLPGFDRDMPDSVWSSLIKKDARKLSPEDHPQYRYAALMRDLELSPSDIIDWHDTQIADPRRNAVISLALRPAPVTDGWLRDGPLLGDLPSAMQGVTLINAPTPRAEALTIAMRLRKAAQDGQTAALITPDRMLTRQVTAALDRWDIVPDDSAGLPLHLSPPGRFLRHVAELLLTPLTAEKLLTILKHPLTHTGSDRNESLRLTRELELHLRAKNPGFPKPDMLLGWAKAHSSEMSSVWGEWVCRTLCDQQMAGTHDAAQLCAQHMALAEAISAGSGDATGDLWDKKAGKEAYRTMLQLAECLTDLPLLTVREYVDLFSGVLSQGEVRDRDAGHPDVLIWGTLEARVQGADVLILAGLNEGSWPEVAPADPWLNRQMRADAGLLVPERRIGLSAHDFQQAATASDVWLTRSTRSEDAETVPSRWVNRLTNLLGGLPDQDGPTAVAEMTSRGDYWLALADALETPINTAPAPRPSPKPPISARPRSLALTSIKTLVRDPYAIYAQQVLRLSPLDTLAKTPDARLRGIATHKVFERFIKEAVGDFSPERLTEIARDVFRNDVDWPSAQLLWEARIARNAAVFLEQERARQSIATPMHFEVKGEARIPSIDFTLRAQADRIDVDERGGAHLYDYKTGSIPTPQQQFNFDMQLLLLAAMAQQGAFQPLTPNHIADATYLGVGSTIRNVAAPLADKPPEAAWADLETLLTQYLDESQGYTARRAMERSNDPGYFDHLSRFGEWDETTVPDSEEVGR